MAPLDEVELLELDEELDELELLELVRPDELELEELELELELDEDELELAPSTGPPQAEVTSSVKRPPAVNTLLIVCCNFIKPVPVVKCKPLKIRFICRVFRCNRQLLGK